MVCLDVAMLRFYWLNAVSRGDRKLMIIFNRYITYVQVFNTSPLSDVQMSRKQLHDSLPAAYTKQHDDNLHRKKTSSDGGSGGQWLIVLVLGAVLEDTRERHVVEVALLVDGRLPEELIHFLVREPVAHGGQQLTELFLLDHSCRRHKRHT